MRKLSILRMPHSRSAARRERERPFAVGAAVFDAKSLVAVDNSPGGEFRGMTVTIDHPRWSSEAEQRRAESQVARLLDAHLHAEWDLDAGRVTFTKGTCPALAYGPGGSVLEERVRLLALNVAEDLFRLRSSGKGAELVVDAQAIEGLEHVLSGLARGDLRFVAARFAQLVRGLRDSLATASLVGVSK